MGKKGKNANETEGNKKPRTANTNIKGREFRTRKSNMG
jgi:hypothetical protein